MVNCQIGNVDNLFASNQAIVCCVWTRQVRTAEIFCDVCFG